MAIAYSARGASGFGAAAAMPLLGLVLPLKVLVPAWTLIGIAAGSALLGSDRKKIAWGEVVKTCARHADRHCGRALRLHAAASDTLTKWLGVLVLAYGLYSLWGTFGAGQAASAAAARRRARRNRRRHDRHRGRHHGQRVLRDLFRRHRLAKDNYRATMTAILLTLTVVRGVGYFPVGEFSRDVLVVTAILFPSMLIGIFIGNRFHHGMSELVFRRTVACALTVSGLALLIK